MPFTRPTLSDLVARARGDIETRLPGADSTLRHSVLDVLARMHGGAMSSLYGYLDNLADQLHPDTASGAMLARHAAIWGVRRKAGTTAKATAQTTGVAGTVIPAGTLVLRVDGTAYTLPKAATIPAGSPVSFAIEAVEAGPDATVDVGDTLTLASAIPGANSTITVTSVQAGGTAEETDAQLLTRLLARIQTPPQGGSASDYRQWALEVAGVTRSWVYPDWMGAGTVGVAFVLDDRADIIPLEADLDAVAAHLETRRPVTAEPVVFAPTPDPVAIQLRLIPDTPEIRTAITAELADFFAREAEPGGTIYRSRLGETISLAAGEFAHVIDLPDVDVTAEPGRLPVLGQVIFV